MVRSTITLLNTINRRNIKSPGTPRVLKNTINDSLDSWLTILRCFSKVRAGPPDEIGFFKESFRQKPSNPMHMIKNEILTTTGMVWRPVPTNEKRF